MLMDTGSPTVGRNILVLAALALATSGMESLRGHTPSETFLTLRVAVTNVQGQWDVALRDLEQGVRLAPERWQAMAAQEKQQWLEALAVDTVTRLEVKSAGRRLGFQVTELEVVKLNAGEYERVKFTAAMDSGAATTLEIDGRALFGVDTNMHGLLRVEHEGRTEAATFNAEHPSRVFAWTQPSARAGQVWTFIREGVGHIWNGPDHLLFLLALLLPALCRRREEQVTAPGAFKPAAMCILGIVTAFTVAHSITLSLAVLGIVRVPGSVVEPLIAASVIAAALNNLRPRPGARGWLVAFTFGLVHGFGLATGLLEFGLRGEALALALVGFNVGVELGQAAIVAVFVPIVFPLAGTLVYRRVALRYGSVAVAMIAGIWMAERLFAFKLLPF